ncbi:hypothetical protein F442_15255 [Phytophthora nicotianae P10297]|uniref:PiggyBac transposable element-derived protein 4 C-terminal zinc-ribbon domain-containing protein n=1 Tax=Phytophthora nicotianae P10297 TaxID=1317064 RepID=W2YPK5_PHYNI|nr:hypothetical protein F442_15255 [Phytophthora nicotianae P10297]
MSRAAWMNVLHNQLLQLKPEDFELDPIATSQSSAPSRRKRRRPPQHIYKQYDDWVIVSGVQKRKKRACKVCALLRGESKKSFQTTFYCEDCSSGDAKFFLCPKARRAYNGITKTCFQIWHEDFECGKSIPESLGNQVVFRRPAKFGTRQKTRRELLREEGTMLVTRAILRM